MAAQELEKILQQLLLPDNTLIQQATLQLKTAFTNPDIVTPALIELLPRSTEPTVRQYCAILLRRRVVRQWKKVIPQTKQNLKCVLLEAITKEPIPFVRDSICQVVGSIARHELKDNDWPDLMKFLTCHVQSGNVNEREIGFTLLKVVCEACAEQLQPWYKELFAIFQAGLSDSQSQINPFLCIRSITYLLQFFGSDEEILLKPMLGSIMEIIKNILKVDEDRASEALDIFDELVQIEVGIIIPYVKSLVQFCMQIIGCADLGEGIRVKSLYLICWACRRKCRVLLKSNLLKPLLQLLLSLLTIPVEDEGEEEEEEELNSLQSVAGQAIDLLALHSPPEKIIPILMECIAPMFASTNCFERKAAYIALGELAEGCADHVRTKYLQTSLETMIRGLSDKNVHVRNASLFAFGQFAEFVQPEVGKFHETVLPTLLSYLQTVIKDGKSNHKGTLTKLFYAIEKFTEGLEKDIIQQYTSGLIDAFLSLLKSSTDTHTIELAVSAIGALATSAQEYLTPSFRPIMDHLKVFLSQPLTLETVDLHAQTVDTIGALARHISADIIKPVAPDCMELGIRILDECEDPDLRRCTYGLFASLSIVLKTGMFPYLEKIGPIMIASLKSTEGIVATCDTTQDPLFLIEDEVDEEDIESSQNDNEDDEDDDPNQGYSVENAYMEEKEDTINSFVEIIENIGELTLPSIKDIYKEIFLLSDYPHSNVRKAAISGGCRLCAVICKTINKNNMAETGHLLQLAKECISSSLRVSTNIINTDDERDVVIAVIEGLLELFEHLKLRQLVEEQELKVLGNSLCDVMKGKANCQQFLDDEASQTSDDETASELDMMLIEKCGDILPLFAKLLGGDIFKQYFNILLPIFIKKSKPHSNVSEKSFAVGTIAEITQAMGHHIQDYAPAIIQCLLKTLKDDDEEVRSNSAFAFGVLAECGGDAVTSYYMGILECFHVLLASSNQAALVQDNICGAISRMIMTAPHALPLDQVVPALVNCLPIKEDERENETTTKCFVNLYASNPSMLASYIDKLLPWFISSIEKENSGLEKDTREKTRLVVTDIQQKFPQQFEQIVQSRNT